METTISWKLNFRISLRLKSMLVRKQTNEMTLDVEGISERVVPGQAGIIMQLVLQMRDGA